MYMKQCPATFQNINLISIAGHLRERLNCQMGCAVEYSAASHCICVILHIYINIHRLHSSQWQHLPIKEKNVIYCLGGII